ncbi:cupin domain-containing protein [Geoalkalibacter halelectricus]|uniref:Cupin domain-containing protein n=1 Tax=Geoalkalibacter halelectricus TaxID=2847045 RepID=A0ABY5ZR22_9BACT|nr:cupin domain-containing protein [Geoalkalibacter halelectricus]MDO3376907.1 cupin domain-containing protein [Geoalkalibacter halelectricus]UWZ81131.1 cupin domain-containing protein [Geoalkalibacter halelectricus]
MAQPYQIKAKKIIAQTPDLRVSEMTLASGEEIPWHAHSQVSDTFYCLEGVARLQTRQSPEGRLFRPGECATLGPAEPHRLSNAGPGLCRVLLIQGVGTYDFLPTAPPSDASE